MLLEPVGSRREISWQPVWFGMWLAITAIGLTLHPDPSGHGTHQELGLPPCPSVLLFDRPCPGCGLTTSWTALLHGQIGFAFHAHPLGPPLYLLFTLGAVLGLYGFFKQKRLSLTSPGMSKAMAVFAVVFLGFGLARMALTPHFRTEKEQVLADTLALRKR